MEKILIIEECAQCMYSGQYASDLWCYHGQGKGDIVLDPLDILKWCPLPDAPIENEKE